MNQGGISDTVASTIKYEQPLNERMRTFLRLEFLFNQVDHYLESMKQHDLRMSINSLIDIVDLIGRTDVKKEVIKELERHAGTLENLYNRPGVDGARLESILADIRQTLGDLRESGNLPGQAVRQDELIAVIKQRNNIPGGTCNFDLPSYYHWLNRNSSEHAEQFRHWQQDLASFKNGISLILHLVRNSTNPSLETAEKGFFQMTLDSGVSCQMIRVLLPYDSPCYPEISGGKHRFTIRFMHWPDTSKRPSQAGESVEFELHCCTL